MVCVRSIRRPVGRFAVVSIVRSAGLAACLTGASSAQAAPLTVSLSAEPAAGGSQAVQIAVEGDADVASRVAVRTDVVGRFPVSTVGFQPVLSPNWPQFLSGGEYYQGGAISDSEVACDGAQNFPTQGPPPTVTTDRLVLPAGGRAVYRRAFTSNASVHPWFGEVPKVSVEATVQRDGRAARVLRAAVPLEVDAGVVFARRITLTSGRGGESNLRVGPVGCTEERSGLRPRRGTPRRSRYTATRGGSPLRTFGS